MGGPAVTRRRRSSRGREDALEALARSLGHGQVAAIHALGCKGDKVRCECIVELVGPAERNWSQ